jgi:hypothetical protein
MITSDAFGREAIRAHAGGRIGATFREAVHCYLSDRDSNRPGWRCPTQGIGESDAGTLAELRPAAIDGELEAALASEADEQGVSTEQLLSHALLYYLADLYSGRLASRLGDELDY